MGSVKKQVNVKFSQELLNKVDLYIINSRPRYYNRSDFITAVISKFLEKKEKESDNI